MARQRASSDEFVVRVDRATDRQALESRAASMGSIEPIVGRDDMFVLRLRDTPPPGRAGWERVQDAFDRKLATDPVMVDDGGAPHYPTGKIGVRFKHPPEADELERFADELKLRLVGVNKYVAAQAMFEPRDPSDYLPERVDVVAADERVMKAWPEALSAFRRHKDQS
jgi:hypothetical protein